MATIRFQKFVLAAKTCLAQLGSLHILQNVKIALSMVSKATFREIIIRSEKLTFTVVSFGKGLKQVAWWIFKLGNEPSVPNF